MESERVSALRRASRADATRRAYAADWADFAGWCSAAGAVALPAGAEAVAAFLAERAARLRPASCERRLAAIVHRHREAGLAFDQGHPALAETRAGIRRTLGVRPSQKEPLSAEDLRDMVAALGDDLAGRRDRALLLLGFAGAFRRAELAALERRDLVFTGEGLVVAVRRGKRDQEARGGLKAIPFGRSAATCPIRALKAWLIAAGGEEGPLFRPIDRHGNLGDKALSGEAVAGVVKRAMALAGRARGWTRAETAARVAAVAGHSLRAGFVTAAAAAGAAEWEIMAQTGHKRADTLRRYIRLASPFENDVLGRIGL